MNQGPGPIDEIDALRAQEYDLLAALLGRAPAPELVAGLQGLDGDGSPLGQAHAALGRAAREAEPRVVGRDYFALFVGVGRGLIMPYASYYLTGFLHERPLARVREELAALGIERATGDFEPEDHLGTLFEVMAGLADGTFEAPAERQQAFFERHIKPWAVRFFADLGTAPSADFYRAVARLGGEFVTIEAEGFTFAS